MRFTYAIYTVPYSILGSILRLDKELPAYVDYLQDAYQSFLRQLPSGGQWAYPEGDQEWDWSYDDNDLITPDEFQPKILKKVVKMVWVVAHKEESNA